MMPVKRLVLLLVIEVIFLICGYLTIGAIYWAYRGHNNLLTALMSLFLLVELWLIILFGFSIRNTMRRPIDSETAKDSE